MNGKTVDNVNEALSPTSDITSANITYLREDYSINVGYAFYTEDNVIPLVDAELGYSIHIITRPGATNHSEIIYVDTKAGSYNKNRVYSFEDGEVVKNSGCISVVYWSVSLSLVYKSND